MCSNCIKNHLIREAFLDFILAKKASLLAPATITYYNYTVGSFIDFLIDSEVYNSEDISPQMVRAYINKIAARDISSATIHSHARGIKVFLRFLYEEDYINKPIKMTMPKVEEQEKRVLSPEEIEQIIESCNSKRDKALLLFFLDTGLRRSEVIHLNWSDVDIESGLVVVRKTKNKKVRSVFIGHNTRRALLKYRRLVQHEETSPLFQTKNGDRFSGSGLRQVFRRLRDKSDILFSAHDLRRTFATLSLKSGMNVFHLQSLMGHSSLEMTRKYLRFVTDDLREAHESYAPVDHYL